MKKKNLPKKIKVRIKQLPLHIVKWVKTNPGIIVKGSAVSLASAFGLPELADSIFTSMITDSLDLTNTIKNSHHISDLADLLHAKKGEINQSFIESNYGHKLIKELIKEIINEVDEDRINYLKNFFVNATTSQNMKEQTIMMFHEKLLQMQPIHLQVLHALHEPREPIKYILSKNKNMKQLKLPADFNVYVKADSFIFDATIDDLRTWNILKSSVGESTIGNVFKDVGVTVNSAVRDTNHRFSGLGDEFVKFMKDGEITTNSISIDYDKRVTYYHSKLENKLKVRDIEKHGFSTKHNDHVNEKGESTDGNSGRITFG